MIGVLGTICASCSATDHASFVFFLIVNDNLFFIICEQFYLNKLHSDSLTEKDFDSNLQLNIFLFFI